MPKKYTLIYWIFTGLICLLMTGSGLMYFINTKDVQENFPELGYPSYLVYPLAVAKFLGVIAILSRKSGLLKEWAYAGFFFDALLAAGAHIAIADGKSIASFIALFLVIGSRIFESKAFPQK